MYEEIKTACLYLRYSSSNQTEQSIEGQMHVCQDFCKRHNIRIVEMYIDRATSASKDIEKRVEFLKMIKDSEKGNFDAVIVYKLDRFARSRYDSATYKYRLKRNGVQLISATENITQDPEGIILESVLEGMAEFYSAELSQKINRGMKESAMKHNSIGGAIPLGYKTVDKKLVIDETTAPIVREAFQMYADGESVAEICRTFNNRGYKTSKGTRFGKSSFTKIFRNEKYIGVYKYHDYRAEDVIPPIIDKDLWDRVQVRVGKIKKAPARNKAKHTYLLTGKLFCGHCGSSMNADGNSNGYLYYRCYGKKNMNESCKKRNMEKNLIERLVAQDAMSFLTDEYIEKIATIACDRNRQEIESDSPIPVIRDRIRQVDVSLNNLLKAIETGSAPDMLVKRMGELETEKKDMEVQLKKEMAHQVYIEKEQVIFWLEKFREGDINDEEFCHTVIDLFVNSVTVWDEPDDKFKITIAYNLTSIPQKTYRLSKDGRLSDYASNTPGERSPQNSFHFCKYFFFPIYPDTKPSICIIFFHSDCCIPSHDISSLSFSLFLISASDLFSFITCYPYIIISRSFGSTYPKSMPFFSDHDIKFRNSPSGSFYDLIHLIVKDPAGLIFSVFFRLADCQAVLFKCHITVFCLHDPPADFYGLTKKQDYRKRQCSTQICKIPASFLVYEKVCADSLCHTAYCCHNKILFFKVHQMIYIIFCRL